MRDVAAVWGTKSALGNNSNVAEGSDVVWVASSSERVAESGEGSVKGVRSHIRDFGEGESFVKVDFDDTDDIRRYRG